MPEVTFIVALMLGIYLAFRIGFETPRRERLKAIALTVSAAAVGASVAAPLLALFGQYEQASFNTHQGADAYRSTSRSWYLWSRWLIPFPDSSIAQSLRGLRPSRAIGDTERLVNTRNWVGSAAASMAAVSLLAPIRFLRSHMAHAFVAIVAVFGWLNYDLPGSGLIGRVPIVQRVLFENFDPPVIAFAVAVLAATGLEAVLQHRLGRNRLKIGVFMAALLVFAALLLNWHELSSSQATYALRQILPVIAGLGAIVLIVWMMHRSSKVIALAVLGAVTVQLALLFPIGNLQHRSDPYRVPQWLRLVDEHSAAADRASSPPHRTIDRIFGFDNKAQPNYATAF